LKAPADPEIRELVMVLSDLAEQNLRENDGWHEDGFCNANTKAIDELIDYGLWERHPDCSKAGDSGLAGKWCGWTEV